MARRGTWTFRSDLVALKLVQSPADLNLGHITHAAIVVQLFNLPVRSLREEGFNMVVCKLSTALSPPAEAFVGGHRFVKMKVLLPLNEPFKDKVKVQHPTLGLFLHTVCMRK